MGRALIYLKNLKKFNGPKRIVAKRKVAKRIVARRVTVSEVMNIGLNREIDGSPPVHDFDNDQLPSEMVPSNTEPIVARAPGRILTRRATTADMKSNIQSNHVSDAVVDATPKRCIQSGNDFNCVLDLSISNRENWPNQRVSKPVPNLIPISKITRSVDPRKRPDVLRPLAASAMPSHLVKRSSIPTPHVPHPMSNVLPPQPVGMQPNVPNQNISRFVQDIAVPAVPAVVPSSSNMRSNVPIMNELQPRDTSNFERGAMPNLAQDPTGFVAYHRKYMEDTLYGKNYQE